jgi:hypothetical protein
MKGKSSDDLGMIPISVALELRQAPRYRTRPASKFSTEKDNYHNIIILYYAWVGDMIN